MSVGAVGRESNTGNKRRRNDDSFVVAPPLFAVADGMGGAQAGEVASKLAAAALKETDPGSAGGEERVVALIQEANRRVYERSNADPAASGMGTTITAALVEGTRVTFGHVGDSRAYLVRDGVIEQLTEDHSLVNELMKSGKLSPEEAEMHPQRSVITRALGTDPDVDVDAFSVEAEAGDVYLICSDGLSDMLDATQIERILLEHRADLDGAVKALVQSANRAGGEDNITAVLFEVVGGGAEPDEQTREFVVSPDEEDTLHPEDGVAPPPAAVDTMVVPAAEIEAALAEEQEAPPQAGIGRRLLALAVIIALIALIVALVWWGLAR
jgi:protein phosphatase